MATLTPKNDLVSLRDGTIVPVPARSAGHAMSRSPRRYKRVRFPFSWEGFAQAEAMLKAAEQRGQTEITEMAAPQIKQMALRLQLADARASSRTQRCSA